MRFLIDCDVLSELRNSIRCDPALRRWFEKQSGDDLGVSVLTLGEIRAGIVRLTHRDEEQAKHLELWLRRLRRQYGDRILPITEAIAQTWGRLSPQQPLPAIDGLLAATALEHDLTIVTRNVADFQRTGARVFNPFSD